jgi:hypothetical protein
MTPAQVMERLGVRSLEGLNLREALELLRGDAPPPSVTATAASADHGAAMHGNATAPASAPRAGTGGATTAPAAAARFDEEDDDGDFEVTFALGDEADGDDLVGDGEGFDEADEDVSTSLDDVPDFDAPAPRAPASAARRATAARGTSGAGEQEAPATAASAPVSLPLRARAAELIEQLRATTPGGEPQPNQLLAYNNLLIGQLDATRAAALVKGLWHTTHERLGTEQLQALIRWSKEDAFDAEAPAVLVALAAEEAARENAKAATGAGNAARSVSGATTATRAPRSGTATRPSGRGGGSR